jgi:hypothetical protein
VYSSGIPMIPGQIHDYRLLCIALAKDWVLTIRELSLSRTFLQTTDRNGGYDKISYITKRERERVRKRSSELTRVDRNEHIKD